MTDDIQCLACGRRMQFLGTHIVRVHGLTASEYRREFDLSASVPLASASYCERARRRMIDRISSGDFSYDHLPDATATAAGAGRGYISSSVRESRSATAARVRPGDAHRLPDGAKRANGRDANRAREAQRRYRKQTSQK